MWRWQSHASTRTWLGVTGLAQEAIAVMAEEDAAVEPAALLDALQCALDAVRR